MAAIVEFAKPMPGTPGAFHKFLLLQNDDGEFTDIARGGPQATEFGSEGLASGEISSGAGFGNLTGDVVPYHANMTGAAAGDYFSPDKLAELPSSVVATGTYQEMSQLFYDSYPQRVGWVERSDTHSV
jgi:hypothetical protein